MKLLHIILAAALLVPFPLVVEQATERSFVIGVDYAHAEKGRGRDGDDDDDDNDNSGSGSRDGADDDDDRDGDRDDDRNDGRDDDQADDDRNDDRANDRSSNSSSNQSSRQNGRVPEDLHLRYPNGWHEKIRNGRYILTDPQGRTVTNRSAGFEDLDRMREAAGL